MKLSLVVVEGKPEGKEIPIRLSQFLIGRDPECHLRPGSPLISKRHCAIIIRGSQVFLRDFDSTNGTLVNKKPLKGEIELKDGDQFSIGPLGFRVKLSTTASDTPKPSPATVADKGSSPPSKPASKKPLDSKITPAPSSKLDDESVMEMLLNLEGDAPAGAESASGDPIPPGSTIMQIVGTGSEQPSDTPNPGEAEQKGDAKKQADKKKVSDPQATSNAAKAILDKYMRRPRG